MKTKKLKQKLPTSTQAKKPNLIAPYIEIVSTIWQKDSHGLFDYEAPQNKCQKQTFNIVESSKIYRHFSGMKMKIVNDSDPAEIPPEFIYIASVVIDKATKSFKVQPANLSGVKLSSPLIKQKPELLENKYLVVKNFVKEQGIQGYPLSPGSIIRLGRVEYVVLEIRNNQNTQVYKQTSHLQLNVGNYVVETPLVGTCKICLCQQSTEQDPLISPCLCKGTCQFIHVGCLKNWINSKVKKEVSDVVLSFNFSKFQCEICKAPFPKTTKMSDGTLVEMITVQKPEKPYMLLQSVNSKQDNKKQRNLHMVFANEGVSLKIGRGHACQMRVTDISVSRVHAELKYANGKFYLKDSQSKFGTLIKFRQQIPVKDIIRLQDGRMCIQFNLKKQAPKQPQQIQTNSEDDL